MAEILKSAPQITLNLPSSQIPLDFNADDGIPSPLIPCPETSCVEEGSHVNKCQKKGCTCVAAPLISLTNQRATGQDSCRLAKQPSMRWLWKRFHRDHNTKTSTTALPTTLLSTTSSNISSVPDFVTITTTYTSSRTNSPWLDDQPAASLLALPKPILSRILRYTFSTPRVVVSLNRNTAISPLFNRKNYITLQQLLGQPVFLVCHSLRAIARDIIFSKDLFLIDLAGLYDRPGSSHRDQSIKELQHFWIQKPPWAIKQSLPKVSRLIIRVPVPSTGAAVRRGREEQEWMDGSDGQGGGGYRIKGMKEETEDSLAIRRCLRGVVQLLVSVEGKEEGIIRNGSRMEKARHSKRAGLRKGGSAKSPRRENHGHSDVGEETEKERKPLKLLEIVLVKRSPWAMVLREALGLVHALRDIPVKGTLRICFELNGRKSVWATKRKELWEGTTSNSEPDGAKLLHDLQHLRVFRPPDIQPIMSPAEFKYVTLSKQGRLLISPTALGSSSMAVQDLIMPATPRPKTALQPAEKQRTDSFAFIMAEGISLLGSALLPNMPTREEGNVEERYLRE